MAAEEWRRDHQSSSREAVWTNERHVEFLNSMEAAFVRTMFGDGGSGGGVLPRLDRYLPDCSESTRDSKPQRRRKYSSSEVCNQGSGKGGAADKKTRKQSSQSYVPSEQQDQVVPQVGDRASHGDTV